MNSKTEKRMGRKKKKKKKKTWEGRAFIEFWVSYKERGISKTKKVKNLNFYYLILVMRNGCTIWEVDNTETGTLPTVRPKTAGDSSRILRRNAIQLIYLNTTGHKTRVDEKGGPPAKVRKQQKTADKWWLFFIINFFFQTGNSSTCWYLSNIACCNRGDSDTSRPGNIQFHHEDEGNYHK